MPRLIDADALPVTTLTDGGYWTKDVVYKTDIDAAPTIDPESLGLHSRWEYDQIRGIATCQNCGFERNVDDNFGRAISCPNCGAKMDLEEGNGQE